MSTLQIVATRKDGTDFDRRIDAFQVAGGQVYTIDRLLLAWDAGDRFFTFVYGVRATVYCLKNYLSGRRYFTTSPDGFGPNNLLSLPNC